MKDVESNQPRIQVAVRILRLVPDGIDYVLSHHCYGVPERARLSDLLYLVFGVFTRLALSAGFRKRRVGREALPTCPPAPIPTRKAETSRPVTISTMRISVL